MSRWDTAPADGGISSSAQEDEARERAEEIEREAYMIALHHELKERARQAMHRIGQNEAGRIVKQIVLDELYWAIREGVRRAESGKAAAWILETEK